MPKTHRHLSRRERQIMDVVYQNGQATAAQVLGALPDPPSYSTVRALLRVLEDKGHLRHRRQGPRYVFRPTVPPETARRSALARVVQTFFDGSTQATVAALIDQSPLSEADLDRLEALIDRARQEGR
ncbi:MAG: BlaI/MecI/CopY family transcriptional regulator [Acidobacteria bacterium]|nr:BlaI/MecI/CopY family transcriptional regulator [Acidobacteriota bacterium]MYH28423.1 BlaI/MecI/CopY family transcriptional regulator [Acidobacteriota bacterium]MYK88053.1 BlaI/MecI/CopY family transcriptional regulator [Acidobacteriota bacterium]MYN67689.1 BlaI/MecI/CopY family transcriptional regulator [Acidobacteriota bacterium]